MRHWGTGPIDFKILVSRRDSEGFRGHLFAALMTERCESPAQGFAYEFCELQGTTERPLAFARCTDDRTREQRFPH